MQPTIAVITAQYFEKMAVDAMMTNKQTFMRYATVGFLFVAFIVVMYKQFKILLLMTFFVFYLFFPCFCAF